MRYYENSMGIFIGDTVPDDCREMTADEFNTRLEEIRRNAAQLAAELEENNDHTNV